MNEEVEPAVMAGAPQVNTLVTTPEQLEELRRGLESASTIWFDLETNSAKRARPDMVGATFGYLDAEGTRRGFYLALWTTEIEAWEFSISEGTLVPVYGENTAPWRYPDLHPLCLMTLCDPHKVVGGHNIKYDIVCVKQHAAQHGFGHVIVACGIIDTMMSAHLLCEEDHKLKSSMDRNLGIKQTTFKEICPVADNSPLVPVDVIAEYAYPDVHNPPMLLDAHRAAMTPKLINLHDNLENPIVPIVADMEFLGFHLDIPVLEALDADYRRIIADYDAEILALVGEEFSPASQTQLSDMLFDNKKMWDSKALEYHLNGRGRPAFFRNGGTLSKPEGRFPTGKDICLDILFYKAGTPEGLRVAEILIDRRRFAQYQGTFTKGLLEKHDKATLKIHSSIFQDGTATGRFSSSEPNLQNIPKRAEEGYRIRKAFVPQPGWILIDGDFSQLEYRLTAHVTRDPGLMEVFLCNGGLGMDPHQASANRMGVSRDVGKTINYAIPYGAGALKIAKNLRCPVQTAQGYLDMYAEAYPKVSSYYDFIYAQVEKTGYATNIMGRRRDFRADVAAGVYWRNKAKNFPIQSFAGDVVKIAMRNLYRELIRRGWLYTKVNILLQVHDELVLESCPSVAEEVKVLLAEIMGSAVQLCVPLLTDTQTGPTWYDCH